MPSNHVEHRSVFPAWIVAACITLATIVIGWAVFHDRALDPFTVEVANEH